MAQEAAMHHQSDRRGTLASMLHLHGTPTRPCLPSTPGAWPRGGCGEWGPIPHLAFLKSTQICDHSGPGRSETLPHASQAMRMASCPREEACCWQVQGVGGGTVKKVARGCQPQAVHLQAGAGLEAPRLLPAGRLGWWQLLPGPRELPPIQDHHRDEK